MGINLSNLIVVFPAIQCSSDNKQYEVIAGFMALGDKFYKNMMSLFRIRVWRELEICRIIKNPPAKQRQEGLYFIASGIS